MPWDAVCLNLTFPGYLFPFLSSVLLLPPSAGFLRGRWVRAERPEPDGEIGAGNERCCCAQSRRLQKGGRLPTPVLVGSSEGALQEDEVDFCLPQRLNGICAAAACAPEPAGARSALLVVSLLSPCVPSDAGFFF